MHFFNFVYLLKSMIFSIIWIMDVHVFNGHEKFSWCWCNKFITLDIFIFIRWPVKYFVNHFIKCFVDDRFVSHVARRNQRRIQYSVKKTFPIVKKKRKTQRHQFSMEECFDVEKRKWMCPFDIFWWNFSRTLPWKVFLFLWYKKNWQDRINHVCQWDSAWLRDKNIDMH